MSSHSKVSGVMTYCNQCQCCSILLDQIEKLNKKLGHYESLLNISPAIMKWIENIRQLYVSDCKKHASMKSTSRKKIVTNSSVENGHDLAKTAPRKDPPPLVVLNSSDTIQELQTNAAAIVQHTSTTEQTYKIPEIVIERVGEPLSGESLL